MHVHLIWKWEKKTDGKRYLSLINFNYSFDRQMSTLKTQSVVSRDNQTFSATDNLCVYIYMCVCVCVCVCVCACKREREREFDYAYPILTYILHIYVYETERESESIWLWLAYPNLYITYICSIIDNEHSLFINSANHITYTHTGTSGDVMINKLD